MSQAASARIETSELFADVLVIGSGVAGCTAALQAADQGQSVIMLTSSLDPLDCTSFWAQV